MKKIMNEGEEFFCIVCGNFKPIKEKGEATMNDKPYNACKSCCYEEQKKQFYSSF